MLYLFTGTDEAKARAKAFSWVAAARAKQPDAVYVKLSGGEITPEALRDAAESSGLFFQKLLVLIDAPFEKKETGDPVLEALDALAASPNPIAILAPKLKAAEAKKLEAKAEKVFKTDSTAKKPSRGFNAPLVNALAARDGRALWAELIKAKRLGDAPEMLHGLLHWKVRELMQKGSRAWTLEEARALSVGLIELISDTRGQSQDLGESLERFALSL